MYRHHAHPQGNGSGGALEVGDVVRINKRTSPLLGATARVSNTDWHGRIQVVVSDGAEAGASRSYEAADLQPWLPGGASNHQLRRMTSSGVLGDHGHDLDSEARARRHSSPKPATSARRHSSSESANARPRAPSTPPPLSRAGSTLSDSFRRFSTGGGPSRDGLGGEGGGSDGKSERGRSEPAPKRASPWGKMKGMYSSASKGMRKSIYSSASKGV